MTALARPHNLSKPACRINSTVLSTAACASVFKNKSWAAPMPKMIFAGAFLPKGRRVIKGDRIFSICPRRRKYVVANNCTNRRSRPSNFAIPSCLASALSSWLPSSTAVRTSNTMLRLFKLDVVTLLGVAFWTLSDLLFLTDDVPLFLRSFFLFDPVLVSPVVNRLSSVFRRNKGLSNCVTFSLCSGPLAIVMIPSIRVLESLQRLRQLRAPCFFPC